MARTLRRVQEQAASEKIRVTLHAQQAMVSRHVSLDEIIEAIANGEILEDYPDHQRGPCCLIYGDTPVGRPLHVVCTTAQPVLIVITAYEPKPPKWATPTQRSM
ncbi:DUF4258 domain-containing protein [bacterium]|nr:DUF4258 domain-containing protein [bacterium]